MRESNGQKMAATEPVCMGPAHRASRGHSNVAFVRSQRELFITFNVAG